jgi:hypothetical protein
MIAQRLIEDARAAGLSMEVDGGDLIVDADCDPPPELLAELREHKAELIALLKPPPKGIAPASDNLSFADAADERAAIVEFEVGVPRAWAQGFAALCTIPAPGGFSPERWQRIIDATGTFLDRWAADAIACGWSDIDVFGCDATAPDRRFDCMVLVLLLDRCEIVAIDGDGADLVTNTGDDQRYRRKPKPNHTVRLWDLMLGERGADAGSFGAPYLPMHQSAPAGR